MSPRPARHRCAVYTRKSSEEGLDQAFNSLDAQREACEAYIRSQRHEGWQLLSTAYDDGGFSGGSLDRPALQRMLADIERGAIDVVVVYKVDRLTRAISDFARMVEIFDRRGVSFVSVTQHFNTTSSMGRLTLNVLLSFAQFEREVTGERIRDKFAASRAKGMWMGGTVPLGYDLKDRRLIVNETEAVTARQIFERYRRLGCVRRLKAQLDAAGTRSKRRVSASGRISGDTPFSRGALYALLKNRLYLGEVVHKGKAYPGQHSGIVDPELWQHVQQILDQNRVARASGALAQEPRLLTGLLHDAQGRRLSPAHTRRRSRRYRYYVSQALLQDRAASAGQVTRLPAHHLERVVIDRLRRLLNDPTELWADHRDRPGDLAAARSLAEHWDRSSLVEQRAVLQRLVRRIVVAPDRLTIHLDRGRVRAAFESRNASASSAALNPDADDEADLELTVPIAIRLCRGEIKVLTADGFEIAPKSPDRALVKTLARGHDWRQRLLARDGPSIRDIARQDGYSERFISQTLRLGFLAPDIVQAILAGAEPPDLTVDRLMQAIPLAWPEQRQRLGFPPL